MSGIEIHEEGNPHLVLLLTLEGQPAVQQRADPTCMEIYLTKT
jgi:hypothetical protein